MGYFKEMDIELQELEQEVDFDWQEEQRKDEEDARLMTLQLDDPHNEFGGMDTYDFNATLGTVELAHIEAQADIQEMIHNGYGE